MNVPSGGIIFGYFFVFCAAASSSDNFGPGYLGASLRKRAPWEGGLNFVGFSSTSGFEGLPEGLILFWGTFEEAWRMVREVEDGAESRTRHIAERWGRRKRGIKVVGGIAEVGER